MSTCAFEREVLQPSLCVERSIRAFACNIAYERLGFSFSSLV